MTGKISEDPGVTSLIGLTYAAIQSGANVGVTQAVIDNNKALFVVRNANMKLTTDQAFTKQGAFTLYMPTFIVAICKTGGATGTCAGGIYPAASKAGTALVASTQNWVTLTAANKIVSATLTAGMTTDAQTATPIFALTTGSTAAATADIFIFGTILDAAS